MAVNYESLNPFILIPHVTFCIRKLSRYIDIWCCCGVFHWMLSSGTESSSGSSKVQARVGKSLRLIGSIRDYYKGYLYKMT